MTYNVVRKVSRSSSTASPPLARSALQMNSPGRLPLLLGFHLPICIKRLTPTSYPPEGALAVHPAEDQPPEQDVADGVEPAAADAAGVEVAGVEDRLMQREERAIRHAPLPRLQDVDLHQDRRHVGQD